MANKKKVAKSLSDEATSIESLPDVTPTRTGETPLTESASTSNLNSSGNSNFEVEDETNLDLAPESRFGNANEVTRDATPEISQDDFSIGDLNDASVNEPGNNSDHLNAVANSPEGTFQFDQIENTPDETGDTFTVTEAPVKNLSDAIGSIIGEYEIVGELGRGGMGVVYKARHNKLHREVALKMILAGGHASKEAVNRFLIEARAVAHLQHKNIVQIFDIGENDGMPYFSLEFVDGACLNDLVADEPLSSREAAKITLILAEALQYAHDEGIVHRDIKPANILIAKDGTPKITDFGLAKVVDNDSGTTRDGQVMGTPSYMPPEQAKGQIKELGPAADQYSLGAMLYRLTTGRPPFSASKPFETVMQVIKNAPLPLRQLQPNVDSDLETICLKTLQKDPAARYENCTELAADLRRYLNNEPINARPVGSTERFLRWCKRNPRVAIPSAAAIAMLIGMTALSTWAYATVSAKNKLIEAEKQYAIEQEKIAKQQTVIADEKTKVAIKQAENSLDIIQSTLIKVDTKLAADPNFNDLRVDISKSLSESLESIDASVLENEGGMAIPTMMAIRSRVIDVFIDQGKFEEARREGEALYKMAKRRLVVKDRNDGSRYNLAFICNQLADTISKIDRSSERYAQLRIEAVEIVKELAANPTPPTSEIEVVANYEVNAALVKATQNLGAYYYSTGNLEKFREQFEEVETINTTLIAELPHDEDFLSTPKDKQKNFTDYYVSNLGKIRSGLAVYQLKQENFEKAFNIFDTVLAASTEASKTNNGPQQRVDHAVKLSGLGYDRFQSAALSGDQEFSAKHTPVAENQIKIAVDCLDDLVQEYPKLAPLKLKSSLAHYRLGVCLNHRGSKDEAMKHFEISRELRAELQKLTPNQSHSDMLMMSEARCGNWETASKMADDKSKNDDIKGNQWLLIARGFALSSLCENAPSAQLKSKSIDAVKKAIENDFTDWFEISYEPDLAAIHGDDSFKKLVAELKHRTKK
ncbi:MAG: protein kinase [Mariniblastus sp.]